MSSIVFLLLVSVVINVFLIMNKRQPDPVQQSRAARTSVRSTIMSEIQEINELATVREHFQSIIHFSEGCEIPFLNCNFPGTTRSFLMRYTGTIVCGCDLSNIKISEQFDLNRIHMILPHSKILDAYADINSFEIYDQHAGIFSSVQLEDQNREVANDLREVQRHAINNGILDSADENARRILTSIALGVGMQAKIIFHDSGEQDGAKLLRLDKPIKPNANEKALA